MTMKTKAVALHFDQSTSFVVGWFDGFSYGTVFYSGDCAGFASDPLHR
jgi:hypothetical protein